MLFSYKNVSTKVAKTYTFVTEVIKNSVEMASSSGNSVEVALT